ncbi:MAG: ATP-binding protein [Nitrospirota bacterium]
MHTPKRLFRQFRALKISLSLKFVIGVAVVLAIMTGTSIYFINKNHKKLVMSQLDQQARALFRQIVLTREWISDHGGVFIERVPWKDPSPYLTEPEIVDTHGKKYVKQSPAMVTKELSKYAKEKGLYWFHITSLQLINPDNAPDEFERTALKEFETLGTKESTKVEKINSSYFYRYIAPLYVEQTCLKCHSHQGYRTGDVRGAISVTVPMDSAIVMIDSGKRDLIVASIVTIGILMMVLFIMMKELVIRPVDELKSSIEDFAKGRKSRTVTVSTGDELEDLSNSFSDMSRTLSEYHEDLEEKVRRATGGLEEANTKLMELNEKKSDFIAKISHELRTPMTSIKGAMDYISARISKEGGSSVELMEFLDVIKNNADRLIRLVNDTLDLERIESGVFDLHYSQVDLLSLMKDVAVSFQSTAGEKNITFKITSGKDILVDADEDRIRQVMINLVSNALRYGPEDSEIEMTVTETGDHVTTYIKDEGPGIPDDIRGKIFDKFYTIGKRHGTGLGLAICKGIIEAHKGEINILSAPGEKYNTFYFTLPRNSRGGG